MTCRSRSVLAFLCAAILAGGVSCGSPNTPTPDVIDIGGAWNGTWTFMTAGATVTDTISVTLTQNAASATGSWSAATGPGGQLSIVVGSSLTGTATINQLLLGGQSCSASASVTGTATSNRVQLALGAFPSAGLCQWGSNQTFDLTR